jgi:hypothetical protein
MEAVEKGHSGVIDNPNPEHPTPSTGISGSPLDPLKLLRRRYYQKIEIRKHQNSGIDDESRFEPMLMDAIEARLTTAQ